MMKLKMMIVFAIAVAVSASAFCFAACEDEVAVLTTIYSAGAASEEGDGVAEETVTEEEQDTEPAGEEDAVGDEVGCCHILEYCEYVAATCENYGNEAYWYCTECGGCYFDEEASEAVDIEDIVIEKSSEHSGEWRVLGKYDCTVTAEWVLECTVCGEYRIVEVAAGEHVYGEWESAIAATCRSAGMERRICINCGDEQTREVGRLAHDYFATTVKPACTEGGYTVYECSYCGDEYKDNITSALGHEYEATTVENYTCTKDGYIIYECLYCSDEYRYIVAAGHDYTSADGVTYTCKNCDDSYTEQKSYTLSYASASDGEGCIVTGLEEVSEYIDLVIPAYYNGMPVTEIAASAFYGNKYITSVTIGENVTGVGASAFYGCTSIQSVYIPESLQTFGKNSFGDCTNITEIYYNAVSAGIEGSAVDTFRNAGKNTAGISLYVGSSVVSIPANLFAGADYATADTSADITEIVFDENSLLESIGAYAFAGCNKLQAVYIPLSCKTIYKGAFAYCTSLTYALVPEDADVNTYAFYNVASDFDYEVY